MMSKHHYLTASQWHDPLLSIQPAASATLVREVLLTAGVDADKLLKIPLKGRWMARYTAINGGVLP